MAELLRRLTRNQMGSARVGSNPTCSEAFVWHVAVGMLEDIKSFCDCAKKHVSYKISLVGCAGCMNFKKKVIVRCLLV